MANCVSCGSEIADGYKSCSMCYGDIGYGSDDYYVQWIIDNYELDGTKRSDLEEWLLEEEGRTMLEFPEEDNADDVSLS